jgi:hypothetical protein
LQQLQVVVVGFVGLGGTARVIAVTKARALANGRFIVG